jgi:hypothetical protein
MSSFVPRRRASRTSFLTPVNTFQNNLITVPISSWTVVNCPMKAFATLRPRAVLSLVGTVAFLFILLNFSFFPKHEPICVCVNNSAPHSYIAFSSSPTDKKPFYPPSLSSFSSPSLVPAPLSSSLPPPLVPVRSRLDPLPSVTAVLLSWKRRDNLLAVVRQLERIGWIREVLVWNNNPDLPLSPDFFGSLSVALRVHNSPVNLKDEAKYTACAMAAHSVCFYQDDDWNTGFYLEGLFRSFLSEPDHLHAVTEITTAWQEWHWTFYDAALGLHTGHAWIGCGAMFRRDLAVQFLRKLDVELVPPEHRFMADCFFALWQNQFPRILVQNLMERPAHEAYSDQPGFLERQHASQTYGIDMVRRRLANGERWGSDNLQSRWTYLESGGAVFLATAGPVNVSRALSWPAERDRGTRHNLPPLQEPYLTSGFRAASEGRCWRGTGSAGYMLTIPRRGRSVVLLTRIPRDSMAGMRLWVSRDEGKDEWELLAASEQHQEGRMVFELSQGTISIVAFLVQPPTNYSGEMSACGFEIA